MAADPTNFLASLNNPNIVQRWWLRANLIRSGVGELYVPVYRQMLAMGAGTVVGEVPDLMAGNAVALTAKATVIYNGLVNNEGIPADAPASPGTLGPIMQELLALLQQLLPMLIACIPVA